MATNNFSNFTSILKKLRYIKKKLAICCRIFFNPVFIFVGMICGATIAWYYGGLLYSCFIYPDECLFGELENLENTFSPINSFFASLTVATTGFLIYIQISDSKKRTIESNIFYLINIHREEAKNFVYYDGVSYNKELNKFEHLYIDFRYICYSSCKNAIDKNFFSTIGKRKFIDKDSERCSSNNMQDNEFHNINYENLLENITQSIFSYGDEFTHEECLRFVIRVFFEESHIMLDSYFHNTYTLLKYINDEVKSLSDRKRFLRIARSQYLPYELILIYYHALFYEDIASGHDKTKFVELIEDTGFLHNLANRKNELIFDIENGNIIERYEKCAFES